MQNFGVKKAECIKDVIMIQGRSCGMFKAFTKGQSYDFYFEDTGDIWTYNDRGNDHIIKDFETNIDFLNEHFSIV